LGKVGGGLGDGLVDAGGLRLEWGTREVHGSLGVRGGSRLIVVGGRLRLLEGLLRGLRSGEASIACWLRRSTRSRTLEFSHLGYSRNLKFMWINSILMLIKRVNRVHRR
jgi:hypothetical protein